MMNPTRRRMILTLIILLALAGVAACATLARPAAQVLVPVEEENKLGQQFSRQIEAELTMHSDPEVQRYIHELGEKVVQAARADVPRGIRFQFRVVDDNDTINAFALPGGYIYFYSGLLLAAENEAEVAGVMGHEIAHVTRRHIAQRLVAMYGLQTVTAMALGQNPGLVGEMVAGVVGNGFLLKYSRDHERDADHHGLRYMAAAGWNPNGFVTFFEKLARNQRGGVAFLQSHPLPKERIDNAKKEIAKMKNAPTYTGDQRFRDLQNRLR